MSSRPGKYRSTIRKDLVNRVVKAPIGKRVAGGQAVEFLGVREHAIRLQSHIKAAAKRTDWTQHELQKMLSEPENYPNLRTLRRGSGEDEIWTVVWDGMENEDL